MDAIRKRVLVLDDEETIRFLLSEVFAGRGYEVLAFSEPRVCPLSGDHACPCEKYSNCVELIVSDVNMLGANGIDFVEELQTKGCRVRNIALMSGAFSERDLERAARLGCTAFPKPIDMAAFLVWVEEAERAMAVEPRIWGGAEPRRVEDSPRVTS